MRRIKKGLTRNMKVMNMKRIIVFLSILSLWVFYLNAQTITSITTIENGFIIDFTLPAYTIKDTNIYEIYGINQTYSYIDNSQLGLMSDIGYPNLPQY